MMTDILLLVPVCHKSSRSRRKGFVPAVKQKEPQFNISLFKTCSYHHIKCYQNHDIKIGNRCFENVAQFRYMGTTITHQNLLQEEIKRRLNSGNTWHPSVQNLLSSRLLSKNLQIRIYKTIISPVVLHGCENWSLIFRLRVFENRVLRGIFGPKRDEMTGGWRKLHNEKLHKLKSLPSILEWSSQGGWDRQNM
jgi:hypothetical protein